MKNIVKGRISVIMGIYNCAATLPDAIDSILYQTYPDWELILCDDGSTDDTYRVAKSYEGKHPDRIIVLRNEKNHHLAYSLNRCLQYASGEFIARMDGDDISLPERFERQIEFLGEHTECHLVGSAVQRFNEEGPANKIYMPEEPDRRTMRKGPPFFHPTVMARRAVYEKLHGYTVLKRTEHSEDMDLWFRFFYRGMKGHNLQEVLLLKREDWETIRRRTFRIRWNSFQTKRYGFRLLGYPRWWILKPAVMTVIKSLASPWGVRIYRKWQKNLSFRADSS